MTLIARVFAFLLAAGSAATANETASLDRAVQSAYEAAMTVIGSAGQTALKRDQEAFLRAKAEAARTNEGDMTTRMAIRLDFLKRIREGRSDWIGSWANAFATVAIESRGGPNYHVRVTATEPVAGRWNCEFDDTAILHRSMMIVGAESAADIAGGPNEGWTLALRLAGDILLLEPLRPRGNSGPMPFCSAGGNVAGNYFHQNDNSPDPATGTAAPR